MPASDGHCWKVRSFDREALREVHFGTLPAVVLFWGIDPPQHREFPRRLCLTSTCGDFFFIHAGVEPGAPLSEQREADLLWISEEFPHSQKTFGK
ncbi:MAG TPA: hypothetical protein VK603_09110 [Candidatus Saccharimonadales bacterium]|nr:hypothetical protein [Candidatus Saccharimonadales bacterium]